MRRMVLLWTVEIMDGSMTTGTALFSRLPPQRLSTVSGPFNGGGLDSPTGIAIDGLNNVFLTNSSNGVYSGGSISEFNKTGIALSPATYGFQAASVADPEGLAIDISGNVWIANFGNTNLLEVIGLAAPTAGPLSSGKPGTRP